MTKPEHSTDPAWAARLAREQALDEAAALCRAIAERQQEHDAWEAAIAEECEEAILDLKAAAFWTER